MLGMDCQHLLKDIMFLGMKKLIIEQITMLKELLLFFIKCYKNYLLRIMRKLVI